jgi:DNA-binding Lrp family transcriptional regulator
MLKLLADSRLSDSDKLTLLAVKDFNDMRVAFTQAQLAQVLGVSPKTVYRRFVRLKEMKYLESERIWSNRHLYRARLEVPGQTGKLPDRLNFIYQPDGRKEIRRLREISLRIEHKESILRESAAGHEQGGQSDTSGQQPDKSDQQPDTPSDQPDSFANIIYLSSYLERKNKQNNSIPEKQKKDQITQSSRANTAHVSQGQKPMDIAGPNDKLSQVIRSASERTDKAREKKHTRRQAKIKEQGDPGPERYETKMAKKFREHKDKPVSEYDVDDLKIVFDEEFKRSGLRGNPFGWSNKERRWMKEFLREQPVEQVVAYVRYVVREWETIKNQYEMNGYPNIAVAYTYRKSWFFEFLNGPSSGKKKKHFGGRLEFDPEAAKNYKGGWGDDDDSITKTGSSNSF